MDSLVGLNVMIKKVSSLLKVLWLTMLSSCFSVVRSNPGDTAANAVSQSIYEFKMKGLDGTEVDFAQFRGKKLLLVNVASECGFTPQYEKLQQLHELYGGKVVIIGFPSNNFGGQEPGTDGEIGAFCKKNYGVTFLMMSKISVKGADVAPLYQWLASKALNGWNDKAPTWNFCKYLINERGEIINFFGSAVDPLGREIIDAINK